MGGYFGAISHRDVGLDVFFGTDYHSHLGTRRGGMVVYGPETGFVREIHDIENTPFRTKFESALHEFKGHIGMGCISDTDPQPLLVRSHLGLYAICTVGIINNIDELIDTYFSDHGHQFMAQSSGKVNVSELVAALINMKENLVEGILYAQEMIKGSITILLMTPDGILAARDRLGRLPVLVGKHPDGSLCVSFESFAYHKLGYEDAYELGPREIVALTRNGYETVSPPGKEMKICGFLWTYYGYPNSNYEGVNVEVMRYRNGASGLFFRISTCLIPSPCRIIFFCRSFWRASISRRCRRSFCRSRSSSALQICSRSTRTRSPAARSSAPPWRVRSSPHRRFSLRMNPPVHSIPARPTAFYRSLARLTAPVRRF